MPHRPASMSQIRALAHEFAQGTLSEAKYREERAALVRKVVAGESGLEYRVPERPDRTDPGGEDGTEFMLDIGEDVFDEPAAGKPSARKPLLVGIAVVVVGALVAGGWWLFTPPVLETGGGGEEPGLALPAGEVLLYDFLQAGDWSPDALDALESGWAALTDAERAQARNSVYWRRFESRLHRRINEQSVLADYDESGIAAETEARLRSLRERLVD